MINNKKNTIIIQDIDSQSLRNKKYIDVFPEYYDLAKVSENSPWHNNQNVLDHVIAVFEGLEKVLRFENLNSSAKTSVEDYLSQTIGNRKRSEILKAGALLHDIAKSDTLITYPDGTAGCPGHELVGASRVNNFSERFGFDKKDEEYLERIVRYHGFINNILSSIIMSGEKEKFFRIFKDTVGDIEIEQVLLMRADLFGSDLEASDKNAYDQRASLLDWMLESLLSQ